MRTAAIIAEYNPFHKGHIYHIEQTRKLTGADCVVAVMSGNFVQRGEPAFADKYTRARCALECADLVLELPTVYAVSSAEGFASGAVSLLDSLGGTDYLSFGTETPPEEIGALFKAAYILANEPAGYSELLKIQLSDGLSFPAARSMALAAYAADESLLGLLSSPNNILALEYVKALIRRNSAVKPVPIQRIGDYRDAEALYGFASAAAVRAFFRAKGPDGVYTLISEASGRLLSEAYGRTLPVYPDDISGFVNYAIAVGSEGLASVYDVGETLANKIRNAFSVCGSGRFEEFAAKLKSRELAQTRIRRALIHILLDLRQSDADRLAAAGYPAYARILGFNDTGREFLSSVKKNASIPIISNCADAYSALPPAQKYLFDKDILASRVYNNLLASKYKTAPADDFRSRAIIV